MIKKICKVHGPLEEKDIYIKKNGIKDCKICRRESQARWAKKEKEKNMGTNYDSLYKIREVVEEKLNRNQQFGEDKMEIVEKEEWRVVPGFSKYSVSNLGNVRINAGIVKKGSGVQYREEMPLQIYKNSNRAWVMLYADGSKVATSFTLKKLIENAFFEGKEIYHLNGNKFDNRLENLALVKDMKEEVKEQKVEPVVTQHVETAPAPAEAPKSTSKRITEKSNFVLVKDGLHGLVEEYEKEIKDYQEAIKECEARLKKIHISISVLHEYFHLAK